MIIFFFFNFINAQVGTTTCSTYTSNPTNCKATGYCIFDGSNCIPQECYQITEIAACRPGGILSTACQPIEGKDFYFPDRYQNVCNELTDTANELVRCYQRSTPPKTGYPDMSYDGITLALWKQLYPQYGNINTLYTINILKQNLIQLNNTFDIYLKYQTVLLHDMYSTYQEETAVDYMMQLLRDQRDTDIDSRKSMLTKLNQLLDHVLLRLRIIGNLYFNDYSLYGIFQNKYSLLKYTFEGKNHKLIYQWTTYSQNGYVQILNYDLHQFGFQGQISNAYEFKAYNKDGTTGSLSYTIVFMVTGVNYQSGSTLQLYSFDRTTWTATLISALTCSFDSVANQSACSSVQSGNTVLFIGENIALCNSIIKSYQCRQPNCNWDSTTQICY